MHLAFLYISLLSLHNYNVKLPTAVVSQFMEDMNNYIPWESTPEKFFNMWQIEWNRIRVMKFGKTQIKFSIIDVFAAVTVFVA